MKRDRTEHEQRNSAIIIQSSRRRSKAEISAAARPILYSYTQRIRFSLHHFTAPDPEDEKLLLIDEK